MATSPVSRNSFTASAQLSLADLIGRIEQTTEIPKTTRQNWCWALRTIARVAGKDPEAIPAHPDFLRRLSAKSAPVAAGLSPGAWNNAKSLMTKAMAWSGLINVPGRYLTPFTAEWQSLWSLLPAKQALAVQLGRFFHYCSANDIRPRDVDDDVLRGFHEAMIQESLIRNPHEAYRGAAKSWNNALERFPEWPASRLTVPSRRTRFSLYWPDLPPRLVMEVEASLEARRRVSLDSDYARPLKPASIEKRRKQLLWYFSALVHSGVDPAQLDRLEVTLSPEMVRQGYDYFLGRRHGNTFTGLSNLAQLLPAVARQIGLPIEQLAVLKRFKRNLMVEHRGLADRHKETLRRFDDFAAVQALLGLPELIRREIERAGHKGFREAKLMQTAVAIELLLVAPVRGGNLSSIELDRHLVLVSKCPRMVHLQFPGDEVKNGQSLEFPLPAETLALIDLYLKEHQPLLSKVKSNFLFPGKAPGRAKRGSALSHQINQTVHKYTGMEMPAHRFRHAVAKIFLDRNPGQYEVIRQLLGHKDIRTTIEFYAGAEGAAAARHFQDKILGLRPANGGAPRRV